MPPCFDSNSTRTESSVTTRPDPKARAEPAVQKETVHNGYRLITRPNLKGRAGLKILVSAVQSRPSPPFLSATSPPGIFARPEFVTGFVPNSGALQPIRAHVKR